jgi:amino-acid N-acetyltransferase
VVTADPITVVAATPADASAILALVESVGLPRAGLTAHLSAALVARRGNDLVGCAALELYEHGALLRSVAIDPSAQGCGLGTRLTERAIELARGRRVPALYLLTTTAERFFARFGFEPLTRDEVPADVRTSVEFTSACPATAAVMRKPLAV